MESYKPDFHKNYRSPQEIEKNLDKIIIQRMRGESSYSPFKYSPSYQQDQFSRLILQGNRSIVSPNPLPVVNSNPYLGDKYFGNIQHQYLNQENSYNRMWNINSNKENFIQEHGPSIKISDPYINQQNENKQNYTTNIE
jgi:hypothetical protein